MIDLNALKFWYFIFTCLFANSLKNHENDNGSKWQKVRK